MSPGRKGEVAEKVTRAIKENEVYIFTDPQLRSPLEERFPRILAAYPQPRSEFHVRAIEGKRPWMSKSFRNSWAERWSI